MKKSTLKTTIYGWAPWATFALFCWSASSCGTGIDPNSLFQTTAAAGPSCAETVASMPAWLGTRQFGVASKSTKGSGIGFDSSGNIYMSGYTDAGLDGNTVTGTQDLFITKY